MTRVVNFVLRNENDEIKLVLQDENGNRVRAKMDFDAAAKLGVMLTAMTKDHNPDPKSLFRFRGFAKK